MIDSNIMRASMKQRIYPNSLSGGRDEKKIVLY